MTQQQQQQQQQASLMFLRQAQAIWERMGMAAMGISMPQSYEEVCGECFPLRALVAQSTGAGLVIAVACACRYCAIHCM